MKPTKRRFLQMAAASAALAPMRGFGQEALELRAQVADLQLLPETYGTTRLWTYGGQTPGPEIRVAQGARVRRRLVNDLPDPTSVHWHGIRIDNAMDGVAGLTQGPVGPGETFDYDFVAPDAGTYWYHAHNRSFEQVARGLYGALIVEEPTPPDVDLEEVLVLDDWRINPQDAQFAEPFGAMHDLSHAGRLGNYVTTNGVYNLARTVRGNGRLRLRVINAATARVWRMGLEGLRGWVVALDGMPLGTPREVVGPFLLAPAQRIDLIVDVTAGDGEAGHLVVFDRDESFSQVAFEVRGVESRAARAAPTPLPPNATPTPDLAEARVIDLRMQGGAMGGMQGAMMGDRMQSMHEIAQSGNFWAFNGAVGGMDSPALADLSLGETVRIRLVNETAFPHAMHLHGMHFYELDPAGGLGDLRDTTLVQRGETREIAFVADNPGAWMLHCHMLSHAASGMMAWVGVT